MPRRTRGVVLGLTTLVVGPILAAAAVTASPTRTAAVPSPTATPVSGVLTSSHVHARIPELGERETPEPTPVPTAPPRPATIVVSKHVTPTAFPPQPNNYPPGSVDAIIMAAAAKWGVDGHWMIRIASCESGERPNAVSSNGSYYGLFQFLPSTFKAHGGTDIFSAEQQSDITANMLAHGGARSWPVCSKR